MTEQRENQFEYLGLGNHCYPSWPNWTYSILYSRTAEYTCYSDAHGTFTEIDTILGHRINLNKF